MLISSELAGFSLNEADNLRKAMGKKKPEIMQKFAEQFVTGSVANGCAEQTAREIWDNIVKFGGYGFNKSHSTAYALITYQTAWCKANHRSAFMAANLSCEMESSDKVKALCDDARRSRIAVLPPDARSSDWEFAVEPDGIRFGLGAIKGTGSRAVQAFLRARQELVAEGRELDLHGIAERTDPAECPRLCWEAIIKAGAFDFTGHNRGAVLAALDSALAEASRAASDRKAGQGSLFDAPADPPAGAAAERSDGIDDSKALSRQDTLRAEYEVLGFYLSGHPLEERAGLFSILSTVRTTDLATRAPGSEVWLAGLIVGLSELVVKSGSLAGRKMARMRLEDLEGGVPVTVFPRTFEEFREHLVEDAVVVCRGKVEERSEEPALILEEVLPVDAALRRFEGGLLIHLEPEDAGLLPSLKGLLTRHPGKRPLFFHVRGNDGHLRRVRVHQELRVDINADLAREVDDLLGRGRVRLVRL